MNFREIINVLDDINNDEPQINDVIEIECGDTLVETYITDLTDDGIIVKIDETILELFINAKKKLNEITINKNLQEAEHRGRKVSLGKPFLTPDGPKKRSVYVRGPKGNVVKVNFGDKKMRIKKSNPQRRKSFRARHRCENPGPRWKARYWSCKFW